MASDGQRLEIVVGDALGRRLRVNGLSSWLRRVAPGSANGRLGIALVSDRCVRTLNRTYRGKDSPTDVLSFPSEPTSPRRTRGTQSTKPDGFSLSSLSSVVKRSLGDIVIARGVARRQ